MNGRASAKPGEAGEDLWMLVHTASAHLNLAPQADAFGASGETELRDLLVDAVVGARELPAKVLSDPDLRRRAQSLHWQLWLATMEEIRAHQHTLYAREILPLLQAFSEVRSVLASGDPPERTDNLAPRWETIELAHDFRSPLTSILFLADTLLHGHSGPLSDHQASQIGIIYAAALRLVSLANDVMALAQGTEHLVDGAPSPFSIRELFHSVAELVQPIADSRSLALMYRVEVDDARIGHNAALNRILLNLCTNALKNTEIGIVELVATPGGGDWVEISVRDTGKGLDEETIRKLYQPFRSVDLGRRTSIDSSGLGLTICRNLVARLDSELRFETHPSWGTRFFFKICLPLSDGAAQARLGSPTLQPHVGPRRQ